MTLLILGVLTWSIAHLFPAVAPFKRKKLMARMGVMPYKGAFALVIVASIVLMVIGWRSTTPVHVYYSPAWFSYITILLVLLTFILFVAAQVKTNIKRVLRHPQLSGFMIWCFAHLLVNGDSRSLVLFLGLFAWAKMQIIFTNRRDGKRVVPEKVAVTKDILTVIGGTVVFTLLLFAHPYLSGVALF